MRTFCREKSNATPATGSSDGQERTLSKSSGDFSTFNQANSAFRPASSSSTAVGAPSTSSSSLCAGTITPVATAASTNSMETNYLQLYKQFLYQSSLEASPLNSNIFMQRFVGTPTIAPSSSSIQSQGIAGVLHHPRLIRTTSQNSTNNNMQAPCTAQSPQPFSPVQSLFGFAAAVAQPSASGSSSSTSTSSSSTVGLNPIVTALSPQNSLQKFSSPSNLTLSQQQPFEQPRRKTRVCNCRKTKCLKLYCDCFAVGELCGPDCKCLECCNNHASLQERNEAIESILEKNPLAFNSKEQERKPKFVKGTSTSANTPLAGTAPVKKGCNCRRSGCQKKYCYCWAEGLKCGELCKCTDCMNMPGGACQGHRSPKVATSSAEEDPSSRRAQDLELELRQEEQEDEEEENSEQKNSKDKVLNQQSQQNSADEACLKQLDTLAVQQQVLIERAPLSENNNGGARVTIALANCQTKVPKKPRLKKICTEQNSRVLPSSNDEIELSPVEALRVKSDPAIAATQSPAFMQSTPQQQLLLLLLSQSLQKVQ